MVVMVAVAPLKVAVVLFLVIVLAVAVVLYVTSVVRLLAVAPSWQWWRHAVVST